MSFQCLHDVDEAVEARHRSYLQYNEILLYNVSLSDIQCSHFITQLTLS